MSFTDNYGAAITGSVDGIDARNYGSGTLSVTTTGEVSGTGDDGILAFNDSFGADLTIAATDVSGAKRRHAYSNLGVGLLGEAMAMKLGMTFPDLLAQKVTGPLGLRDTTAKLTAVQASRSVQPKNTKGDDVLAWTFDALTGAAGAR